MTPEIPDISVPQAAKAPLIALHGALLAVGGVVLALDAPVKGWGVFGLVCVYLVALLVICRRSGNPALFSLAGFLALVSIFQVLPDWILVEIVQTLNYPQRGGPRVDDVVPVAMAIMWVAPLFMAIVLAGGRPLRTALIGGGIFLGAEFLAPIVDLWEPVGNASQILGVAVYVIPAEMALGWAAAFAFGLVRERSLAIKAVAAASVATFYTGALVMLYFVIDLANWRIVF